MIRGPIPPAARALGAPLRTLVEHLEPGLTALQEEIDLDGRCTIDLLAVDASRRAVCCFAAEARSDTRLAAELLEARRWLEAHAGLLARLLAGRSPRFDLPPRFVVIGSELPDAAVSLWQSLGIDELELHELHRVRFGAQELTGFARRDRFGADNDDAATGPSAYSVPSGITQAPARELCSDAMELLQRLDPQMQAIGDRFGRQFFVAQRKLVELRGAGAELALAIGDAAPVTVRNRYELDRQLDRALRLYLELQGLERPGQGAASAEPSFAAIERSMRAARLSESEQAALGQAFAEAGIAAGTGPPD